MPVLRKALAVLHAPEAEVECAEPDDGSGDPRSMSVAEMERRMAKCPAVQRAAANQGMTLGELARAYKALTLASYRMAEEESAKRSYRPAGESPTTRSARDCSRALRVLSAATTYSSSSAIPAGTSCGATGSSTRGGGVS